MTLCCALGGESGRVLRTLVEDEGIEVDDVVAGSENGAYLHDRRSGERVELATSRTDALSRHALDDLYGAALTAGLLADVTVLTGADEHVLAAETYRRLAVDLANNGRLVIADLSGDQLVAAARGGVDVVKASEDDLRRDGLLVGADDQALLATLAELAEMGARLPVVTRAKRPLVALVDGEYLEAATPTIEAVDHRGAGDSLTGAMAATMAAGADARSALRIGAAAGATNMTRRGLATGTRATSSVWRSSWSFVDSLRRRLMNRRVLITNDDGIASRGLGVLVSAAQRAGLDVLVAAPSWDASGASASLTSVESGGRLSLERRQLADAPDVEAYAVEAAPAFITWAAITGAFGAPPDLVLSGINQGPNTGRAVLHSGTVGAALTACAHDLVAAALSMNGGPDAHWATAAAVADVVLPWLARQARPVALNVNVPNVALDDLRGIARARLASHGAVRATVTERGSSWVQFEYGPVGADHEPGTDVALLADNHACFTPLSVACEATDVDTDALTGGG